MTKVIIIGGKGTAVCIAEQIIHAHKAFGSTHEFLGWAIDDPALGDSINGYPVLCKTTEVGFKFSQTDVQYLFALYKPEKMRERVELRKRLGLPRDKFFTFVHPLGCVLPSARIGVGTVILSHCTLQSNVTIGDFAIINSNVVIEHDSQIGDSTFIAAGACIGSAVRLGEGTFIGLNSTLREGVSVGDFAFVGMGSNITQAVEADSLVYGNPGRRHA